MSRARRLADSAREVLPQNPWLVAGNWKRAGGEAERRFRLRDLRKGAVVGWLAMEGPPCIELWWWRRCNGGGLVGLWIEGTHGNGEEPGGEGEPANAKSDYGLVWVR